MYHRDTFFIATFQKQRRCDRIDTRGGLHVLLLLKNSRITVLLWDFPNRPTSIHPPEAAAGSGAGAFTIPLLLYFIAYLVFVVNRPMAMAMAMVTLKS